MFSATATGNTGTGEYWILTDVDVEQYDRWSKISFQWNRDSLIRVLQDLKILPTIILNMFYYNPTCFPPP